MGRAQLLLLLLMSSCSAPLIAHANSESSSDRLPACVAEPDDARRLRCYDQAMGRPPSAAAGSTAAAPGAAAPRAPAPGPSQGFGASQTQAAKKTRATEPSTMTAKVTSVVKQPNTRRLIRLDNDQMWAEQETDEFFSIKVGDTVTVSQGALGSFWLSGSSAGKAAIRVRRAE